MAIDYLENNVVDLFDAWAVDTPDAAAVEWNGESLSYAGLRNASLNVSKALLSVGAGAGDKIPILSQMSLEFLPAVLGILRVGACYIPVDLAAWSQDRIDSTLKDISPRVAIATQDPVNASGVPVILNFPKSWLSTQLDSADVVHSQLQTIRQSLDNQSLVYTTFTSGTTGKPKGVMIYHRALYKFATLRSGDALNTQSGERVLLAFSISFDACAATIWSTITRGGTLVMATWATFPDIATTCTNLILTPSMFATLDPAGPYEKVRSIYLGAEAANFDIARQWITPTRKVVHTYGPSEATIVISYGRITEETETEPDLGVINPGVEVYLVDEDLQECEVGEILIGGPVLAAGYLNNPELTAKKFIKWNGKQVYRTGDLARRTSKGLSWVGRADRMVKNRGFLVNLETEVEAGMLQFEQVRAASAFVWRGKLMGFVQPAAVQVKELRAFMKTKFDPFVIPDAIITVGQLPLTTNGKVDRAKLYAGLEEEMGDQDTALSSMRCSTPHDALRWAFARCLHLPIRTLNDASSFFQLGGNSLAAIQLSKLLRQQGFAVAIVDVLRDDTIASLQNKLTAIKSPDSMPIAEAVAPRTSDVAPVTDMHRLMLLQSARNPRINCQMCRGKYTGPPEALPGPSELRAAWISTLGAHSIFQTRYDMQGWTLQELDHVNLTWDEVCVEAEDFDLALLSVQERVYAQHKINQPHDLEVPYCHMTCVYAPARKAIGFVWRIHHVLSDIFAFVVLMRNLEQALAGEIVLPGPRIAEWSLFMEEHKRNHLEEATQFWASMMKPLTSSRMLELKPPQGPYDGSAWQILPCSVATKLETIEASARFHGITSSTLITAAWALAVSSFTGDDFVSFNLSRSGRMAPWPQAATLVAAINCRVPFGAAIPTGAASLNKWLTDLHTSLLNSAELENLCASLDPSICPLRHFNSFVQPILYMPELPSQWEVVDRMNGQAEPVGMVWRVMPGYDGAVQAELEINPHLVDRDWGGEVNATAVRMLERLVKAPRDGSLCEVLKNDR